MRKHVDQRGYVLVRVGKNHPMAHATGLCYEHRLAIAERSGRVLARDELVHHENEIKGDNDPLNLEITSRAEHVRHHNPRQGTGKPFCSKGHARPSGSKCRVCENDGARRRQISKARDQERMKAAGVRVGAIWGAIEKAKTHCPAGHPYSAENTIVYRNRRKCKTCHRQRESRRRMELKNGV